VGAERSEATDGLLFAVCNNTMKTAASRFGTVEV